MVYSALRDFLMTDHPLVERCRVQPTLAAPESDERGCANGTRADMATPEQSTQSEICNPKSKIGRCVRRGLGQRQTLCRSSCTDARFMRGYARLSAVRRANARFELFRLFNLGMIFLHQIAPFCTKLRHFERTFMNNPQSIRPTTQCSAPVADWSRGIGHDSLLRCNRR